MTQPLTFTQSHNWHLMGQKIPTEVLIDLLTERAEAGLCSEKDLTDTAARVYEAAEKARQVRVSPSRGVEHGARAS
jgi:hypothetical protein